jgi:hypothetical protein
MTQPDPRSLTDPMAQLEAEIAAAEQRGEPLPEQAYLMLAKLRELMDALRGLDETLGRPAAQPEAGPDSAPDANDRGDASGDSTT